jgi:hypothetical protein
MALRRLRIASERMLPIAGFVAWVPTRRFRDRFERDAAGRSLREAEAELADLAREGKV